MPAVSFFDPDRMLGGRRRRELRQRGAGDGGVKPEAVINCIGIIKQLQGRQGPDRQPVDQFPVSASAGQSVPGERGAA